MTKRTNWKTEFSTLLASQRLTGRDRVFIESLHRHWTAGKAMTSGRKHHFFLVKERIAQVETRLAVGASPEETELNLLIQKIPERSWDRGFAESVLGQLAAGRTPSEKQKTVLEKITARYSEAGIEAASTWAADYAGENRDRMIQCAKYYRSTTYYHDLVDRVLTDSEFVPSAKQFDAMTTNKYATKVLGGYSAAPKFAIGSTVQPAAGCDHRLAQQFRRGAMVISVNEDIISACKGNRRYKILPIGGMRPILIEERHIKVRR
jgi:hypothetical protein